TLYRELVLRGQLVHAENRNDVLQVFESLQDLLHPTRDIIVLLAHDFGRQGAGRRGQWINRRIDPQFGNRPIENQGGVEMRKGGGGGGVGKIIGRHVHGLKRRDRPLLGRGDALLKRAHFRGEGRLVADGACGAAEQRGHFGARLREPEDVVDEQQDILVLL